MCYHSFTRVKSFLRKLLLIPYTHNLHSLGLVSLHSMYKVSYCLHLRATPSDFFSSCASWAYYMLDAVLNTSSCFWQQLFEAGICYKAGETEAQRGEMTCLRLRASDLQTRVQNQHSSASGHMLWAILPFFQPPLPVLQLGISSSFSHWQVCWHSCLGRLVLLWVASNDCQVGVFLHSNIHPVTSPVGVTPK